jgi:hypothetical protein
MEFWQKHCSAVPLVKAESTNNGAGAKKVQVLHHAIVARLTPLLTQRKANTCHRCQTIMYPGPTGSPENHKKGFCSDGALQVINLETPPDWPQPPGIFEKGKNFNPMTFLTMIHDVYEKLVIE